MHKWMERNQFKSPPISHLVLFFYAETNVKTKITIFIKKTTINWGSYFWALLVTGWVTIFAILCMFKPTRKILQAYPDQCSFYMFKVYLFFVYFFLLNNFWEFKLLMSLAEFRPYEAADEGGFLPVFLLRKRMGEWRSCWWSETHQEGTNEDWGISHWKNRLKGAAVCRGPDPGYIATSGCIVSAALAILEDKDTLPKQWVDLWSLISN